MLDYRIHTDAIKGNPIPPELIKMPMSFAYAEEADLLNVVLFGKTAKEWRDLHLEEKGNTDGGNCIKTYPTTQARGAGQTACSSCFYGKNPFRRLK